MKKKLQKNTFFILLAIMLSISGSYARMEAGEPELKQITAGEIGALLFKGEVHDESFGLFYYDGFFYVSVWDFDQPDNEFGTLNKYKVNGETLEYVSKVKVSGLPEDDYPNTNFESFTTDGTYIYAVNRSQHIYVFNPLTMVYVKTITSNPEGNLNSIAYDEDKGGFWVVNSDPQYGDAVWFMDKNGVINQNIILEAIGVNNLMMLDIAYDNVSDGGPYVWVSSGTVKEGNALISRFHIPSGSFQYNLKNVGSLISERPYNGGIYMYEDYSSGKRVMSGILACAKLLYGYEMANLGSPESPGRPVGLKINVGANGALKATLAWQNPSAQMNGKNLTELSKINIYRNGELLHTINNPVKGEAQSWQDQPKVSGLYEYKVVGENSKGEGLVARIKSFVGRDVPAAVPILDITYSQGNARLTWEKPLSGLNGGWIDESSLAYKIVRNPGNKVVADNLKTYAFVDNTVTSLGYYSYTVISKTTDGEGGDSTTEEILLGEAIEVPWKEDLEKENCFSTWTVIDVDDKDGGTFTHYWIDVQSANGFVVMFPHDSIGPDDWLVTPPIKLEVSKKYRLKWFDITSNGYNVYIGKQPTIEGLSTLIHEHTAELKDPDYKYIERIVEFSVNETGNYYIGWYFAKEKAHEDYQQVSMDNFEITEIMEMDLWTEKIESVKETNATESHTFNITVRNQGSNPANNYEVSLVKIEDNNAKTVLASKTITESLAPNSSAQIAMQYTPMEKGKYNIVATANVLNDINQLNDTSAVFSLNVFPKGTKKIMVGEVNYSDMNWYFYFPFYLKRQKSAAQCIFFQDELQQPGVIHTIRYYYDGEATDLMNQPGKIYMANTSQSEMLEWMNDGLELVFDGNIDFPFGKQEITITLDKPFLYTGDNLMVYTVRDHNMYTLSNMAHFSISYGVEHRNRSRVYASNSESFNFSQEGTILDEHPDMTFMMHTYGAPVKGIVTGMGNPVEGGKVQIMSSGNIWTVTTDTEGKYEFPLLPAGSYGMQVMAAGYKTSPPQSITIGQTVLVKDFDLTLQTSVKVSGKVITDGNTPLKDVNVLLNGVRDYKVLTDASGSFVIPEVIGETPYTLYAYYNGKVFHKESVAIEANDIVINNITLNSCESNPVQYLVSTTDIPKRNIYLEWEAPEGIIGDNNVAGYNVYRDNVLLNRELVTFTKYTDKVTAGSYDYKVTAVWNNGCESQAVNKTVKMSGEQCDVVVTQFPFRQGFEHVQLPECWDQLFLFEEVQWSTVKAGQNGGQNPSTPRSGEYNAYISHYSASYDERTRLVTSMLDISKLTEPVLNFWHAQANTGEYNDILSIHYKNSPDGGWREITMYDKSIKNWTSELLALPEPTNTYWIGFEGDLGSSEGIVLDDIVVFDRQGCNPVENLAAKEEKDENDRLNVRLTWDMPFTLGTQSYTIKRDGVVLTDNWTVHPFYVDQNVEMKSYEYEVIVNYNKSGCDSSREEKVNITVTSIEDMQLSGINISPIPARSFVNINGENISDVQVFNPLGNIVDNIRINGQNTYQLNVGNYSPGVYLFKIRLTNDRIVTKRVIVIE